MATFAWLISTLRWLTAVLILRVWISIVSNYVDYFPPNFESLFLQGRETTFVGSYPPAFYVHIVSGPFVLLAGLLLVSDAVRVRFGRFHRWLGRAQVAVLLILVLPSSAVMSRHAFGGWPAGASFWMLSAITAFCAVSGVVHALRGRFDSHRRWMLRTFVLICSAVTLRVCSGALSILGVQNPETAYIAAAWASWLIPLAALEVLERRLKSRAS